MVKPDATPGNGRTGAAGADRKKSNGTGVSNWELGHPHHNRTPPRRWRSIRLVLAAISVGVIALATLGITGVAFGFEWTLQRAVAVVLLALITVAAVGLLLRGGTEGTASAPQAGIDAAVYLLLLMAAAFLIVLLATGLVDGLTFAAVGWLLVAIGAIAALLWVVSRWRGAI